MAYDNGTVHQLKDGLDSGMEKVILFYTSRIRYLKKE